MLAAAALIQCAPGSRIIDLGSGDGRNTILLAEQGCEVDAIDMSASAIGALRTRIAGRDLPIRTTVGDICAPDIDFSIYHAVVCTFVLHFLSPGRAHELLDRARSRAMPGAIHLIGAMTTRGDFFECLERSAHKGQGYYPEPGEIAEQYRASGWQVHHNDERVRPARERHPDGAQKRNLVSLTIATV